MQINEKQLAQVNHQIQRLIAADNFYGKRLKEAGVDHVSTVEDFLNLPFSEKQDLREAYPRRYRRRLDEDLRPVRQDLRAPEARALHGCGAVRMRRRHFE